jgi:hypothetical protein
MKSVKKYIIEFFVIVLGVSVSFLAEQWRQDMNTRQERDELIEKAKNELKLFLEYDSIAERGSPEVWLRKFIFEKSTIDPDSFLVQLPVFVNGGNVTNRFPNLLLVAQRKDLNTDMEMHFREINAAIEFLKEIDDISKNILFGKLWKVYQRYNIDYDLTNGYQNLLNRAREGGTVVYDDTRYAFYKSLKKKGNYADFFRDMETQLLLRDLYNYLIGNRLEVVRLKALYKELIKSTKRN